MRDKESYDEGFWVGFGFGVITMGLILGLTAMLVINVIAGSG